MPLELDQPVSTISPDAAVSALLFLFHSYVTQMEAQASIRIGERIYLHLESLAQREDLPEVLHQTCNELSDAWQVMRMHQQGRLS